MSINRTEFEKYAAKVAMFWCAAACVGWVVAGVLLAALLVGCNTASAAEPPACLIPSDLNNDGQINLADASTFGDCFEYRHLCGDINGDGQTNLADATKFGRVWAYVHRHWQQMNCGCSERWVNCPPVYDPCDPDPRCREIGGESHEHYDEWAALPRE